MDAPGGRKRGVETVVEGRGTTENQYRNSRVKEGKKKRE